MPFASRRQHLEAHHAFAGKVQELVGPGALTVASPDPGGAKRAQLWREELEVRMQRPVGFAMIDKRRSAGLVGGTSLVSGEVEGATVLLVDDLVATGTTLARAALALKREGAARVIACAAHGLFVQQAGEALQAEAIERLIITDSVPAFRLPEDHPLRARLDVVSSVPLFARAIRESWSSWTP